MATVNKRTWRTKDGKEKSAWYADYFDQDGKRHIKTFERKKDAEDWLAKTQVEVKEGTHTSDHKSLTVAEAASRWIYNKESEGLRGATIRRNRERVQSLIAPSFIANEKLFKINHKILSDFFGIIARNVSLTSAHMALQILREVSLFLRGVKVW